ncbi:2-succinyl-6-hydroxy-2,4-cyclohexadiene-1-carboxylate synthase [Psychromonas sp. 14N.309.X.WAT.B.A12]|uniref:2-succinyl-6-hydroxy-2, 4-cyclohexadiene-1-carboxylate synthase n=1 Tax=unclassified Psychromonas TaxID=2614957 RepID=UPI0025B24B1F|nr:2-succinyl-6-hydroxy-2,4-cyclohexadiene-1-carboxylate synthase [Psychromonas sp. 14N.309.X.WAT.B.A12]MDN2663519.1 2-succinyl-6-hydroxy-2,4-cyclohexadiene-1-carboxylate synthase [Psychromonas sp. 14N.309.X.WAT.B.A12]
MPLYSEQQGSTSHPTLVFLHGFLGNRNDWQSTIEALKDDYHCVTIDLPGHGRSAGCVISLENGFENCHQLIQFTLATLNIHSFILIGYSLGGRIALDYARTQADQRLQHLVLESCHLGLDNEQEKQQRRQFDLEWASHFATNAIDESLMQWYSQPIFNDLNDIQKQFIIEKRSHNYGVFLANMLLSTSLANQQCASHFLKKTDLPITYLYGEKDTKFARVAALFPTLKNIKIRCFTGLGHNTHQQDPLNYANTIKQLAN